MGGGAACRISIIRKPHVNFKKVPCCMSLRPKKGHVTVLILGVYTHNDRGGLG